MSAVFFSNQSKFRKWLELNHAKKKELIVGYYKVGSGKTSMTWSESVDVALCFGWIDGIRRSIDLERYCIRFTPRKAKSIWSTINIRKILVLKKQGLMHQSGIETFQKREENKSGIYSYEKLPAKLETKFEKKFRANKKAWAFFHSLPPSYRKPVIHWVMSAKQEATRIRRLDELIRESETHRKIKQMSYGKKKQ